MSNTTHRVFTHKSVSGAFTSMIKERKGNSVTERNKDGPKDEGRGLWEQNSTYSTGNTQTDVLGLVVQECLIRESLRTNRGKLKKK